MFSVELSQQRAYRFVSGVGENERVRRVDDRRSRSTVSREKRLVGDERQKLFRPLRGAERPEARTDTAGENDGPAAHSPSVPLRRACP